MNAEVQQLNLPLSELFLQLRQAGLPLGIDEYQLLLRALQCGFGLPDRAALSRVCKVLWIKSSEEERLFDYHFASFFPDTSDEEPALPLPQEQSEQPETPVDAPTIETPVPAISSPNPELALALGDDEAQIAKALRQPVSGESGLDYDSFVRTDEYFPITRRQMKQSWRYLRRSLRQGPRVELDIEATVNQAGRLGILLEPVLIPRRTNQAELFLFIDQGGSMVPFHALSHRLADTAMRGGRLGKAHIYYFHNWPEEYLYRDPYHVEAEPVQSVLNQFQDTHTVVLIFSDAGAARGGFHEARIDQTARFLGQLKQRARYSAWLNPMPRSRWIGTTAGEIMSLIPMFDISRRGLDQAINVLRGRPISFAQRGMRK